MAGLTNRTRSIAAAISSSLSSSNPKTQTIKPKHLSLSLSTKTPHNNFFKTLTAKPCKLTTTTRTPLYSPTTTSSSPSSDLTPPDPTTTTTSTTPTLKSRLENGDILYGLFLLSFSPTLAEIAALSGYDYVVVDMEHGPGGIPEALECLRTLAATRTPAILRLPESSATWAKKALDLGPQGIMFPMIESAKDARKAVSYCRFPPEGIRGSAHTVVRGSGYGFDEGYLSNYLDDLLIMCQVESEDGVDKVEDIASVDGIDCVQMGPLDLSASMGYLWDPGHRKVREMLSRAERGVLECGKAYLGGFAMPHDSPIDLKSRGYHMVAGAVDVGLFRNAAVEDVSRFRLSLINGDDDDYDVDGAREEGKDVDEKYWSE